MIDNDEMLTDLIIDAILTRLTSTETLLDDFLNDFADFDATTDDAQIDDDIILNLTRALLHACPINTDSDFDDMIARICLRADTAD